MHHSLDNDAPGWECVTCGQTWAGATAFMTDPRDCSPTWTNRILADELAPIVWTGTEADEYAGSVA